MLDMQLVFIHFHFFFFTSSHSLLFFSHSLVVYECVRTITTIYPNPLLLDAAATAISRFIRSDSHNLKYIGIKGLATIVKDHPK